MAEGEIASLLLFLGILLLIIRYRFTRQIFDALKAPSLGLVSIFAITSLAAGNPSDSYYFFHGFFTVTALLVTPVIVNSLTAKSTEPHQTPDAAVKFPGDYALAPSLILLLSPIIFFGPPHESGNLARTVGAASAVTYYWNGELSGDLADTEGVLERTLARVAAETSPTYFDQFSSAISTVLEKNHIDRGDSLLFISADGFQTIEALARPRYPWSTGLLVTAVTGMTLVYSVDDSHPEGYYGFISYGADSHRRDYDQESLSEVCSFGRPVVIANDLTSLQFSLHCPTSP